MPTHDRSRWPFWVRHALLGVPSRRSAWIYFWLALSLAVGCVNHGFADPVYFAGGFFFFAALWYFLAIRWVDRNGRW